MCRGGKEESESHRNSRVRNFLKYFLSLITQSQKKEETKKKDTERLNMEQRRGLMM